MKKNKLLLFGLGGTLLAAICCFSPLLPIVLTAIGLSGVVGIVYTDVVLLPILAVFLLITTYALWRAKR